MNYTEARSAPSRYPSPFRFEFGALEVKGTNFLMVVQFVM
jgi:hypothetical protein